MNGGHLSKSQKEWTPARKKAFVVSVLRSGTRRWPPKFLTLEEAKTSKKINPKSGRLAQFFRCNICKEEFPAKEIQVDHIVPAVDPTTGFTTWDSFVENLYCDKDNLQAACVSCHSAKTKKEKDAKPRKTKTSP